MKKIYVAPLTKVVKINAVQMLCASPGNVALDISKAQISDNNEIGDKDYDDEDVFDDLW